jgi:hypothetical protein
VTPDRDQVRSCAENSHSEKDHALGEDVPLSGLPKTPRKLLKQDPRDAVLENTPREKSPVEYSLQLDPPLRRLYESPPVISDLTLVPIHKVSVRLVSVENPDREVDFLRWLIEEAVRNRDRQPRRGRAA